MASRALELVRAHCLQLLLFRRHHITYVLSAARRGSGPKAEPANIDILPMSLGSDGYDKASRLLIPLPSIQDSPASTSGRQSDWAVPCMSTMEQHPSVSALRMQERTLRALLDKANKFGHSYAQPRPLSTPPSSSAATKLYDPDVTRLRDQLITCCAVQRPGEQSVRDGSVSRGLRGGAVSHVPPCDPPA